MTIHVIKSCFKRSHKVIVTLTVQEIPGEKIARKLNVIGAPNTICILT